MSTAANIIDSVLTLGLRNIDAFGFCKSYHPVQIESTPEGRHTFIYEDGSKVELWPDINLVPTLFLADTTEGYSK